MLPGVAAMHSFETFRNPRADEVELKDVHHLNQTAEEIAKLSLTFMYE
jgi:hypothetical protein